MIGTGMIYNQNAREARVGDESEAKLWMFRKPKGWQGSGRR
jgi:hypothetical protein